MKINGGQNYEDKKKRTKKRTKGLKGGDEELELNCLPDPGPVPVGF
jgi:hypothetical protein